MYDTPIHFLVDLAGNEGRAQVINGRLMIRPKRGFMTTERTAFVDEHRSELMAALEDEESFRLAMAVAIFDAESYFDLVRCPDCGAEHNREVSCYRCVPEVSGLVREVPERPPSSALESSGAAGSAPAIEDEASEQIRRLAIAVPHQRAGEG